MTRCDSIFSFASLVGIPIGITISAIGLKVCAIIAGAKKYKSIIKKERSKHDKTVLYKQMKFLETHLRCILVVVNLPVAMQHDIA